MIQRQVNSSVEYINAKPTDGVTQVLNLTTSGGSGGGDTFTITPNAALKAALGYSGTATAAIAYNAAAADVQAALVALCGAGTFVCTGGALPTQVVITCAGTAAGLTIGNFSTTNSGGVTSTITTATAGVTGSFRNWVGDAGLKVVNRADGTVYENYGTVTVTAWRPLDGVNPVV